MEGFVGCYDLQRSVSVYAASYTEVAHPPAAHDSRHCPEDYDEICLASKVGIHKVGMLAGGVAVNDRDNTQHVPLHIICSVQLLVCSLVRICCVLGRWDRQGQQRCLEQ